MGVSGCGKSTVGTLLAEALGCRFLEGDDFHDPAALAKMKGGAPLTDADRWPWLDRIGKAAAQAIAGDRLVVVACSALRRSYRERLQSAVGGTTRFVLLDNDREEILKRLLARPHHFMPATLLDNQFATLERPTFDEPAAILRSDVPPTALCEQTLEWLRASHPVG